ncbi:hypothetical protein [Serratia quinivorans]|uniref:hypothetical protein n=2 Tax=Serratia TaxID=613 RepID=UPI00217B3BC8|nr:hypothetical protein [Serratia quinivorans]CAI1948114.1 Uncharacterised protein [Serratia quinivorans]CAI2158934.1 Uncharacterised protein [Serratia quinivorans]
MPNCIALSVPLLIVTLLLSGCKAPTRPPAPGGTSASTSAESLLGQEVQRLRQCQQQLKALRTLQDARYPATQGAFDRLMRGAAQYASLRTSVNESTQDTVDALYRYRVNLLCAQINQAVLNRLAEQGGAAP